MHTGIDINASAGETVLAPFEGIVREVSWHSYYGGVVVIDSLDGTISAGIGHLQCDLDCEDPTTDECTAIDHTQNQSGRPSPRYCSSLQSADGFDIHVGKRIRAGCTSENLSECALGKVGANDFQQNGGWDPHIHITLRYGPAPSAIGETEYRYDDEGVRTKATGAYTFRGYSQAMDGLCPFVDASFAFRDVCGSRQKCGYNESCNGKDDGVWASYVDESVGAAVCNDSSIATWTPGSATSGCNFPEIQLRRRACVGTCGFGCSSAMGDAILTRYNQIADSDAFKGVPCDNGNGAAAHDVYGVLVQDYCAGAGCPDNASPGRAWAIMYSPEKAAAFVVKEGFWGAWKCLKDGESAHTLGGATLLGAPMDEEHQEAIDDNCNPDPLKSAKTVQRFENGCMWFDSEVHVHVKGREPISGAADGCGFVITHNPPGPEFCDDECIAPSQECADDGHVRICGNSDPDVCTEWLTLPCSLELTCEDGECVDGSTDSSSGSSGVGGMTGNTGGSSSGGSSNVDDCSVVSSCSIAQYCDGSVCQSDECPQGTYFCSSDTQRSLCNAEGSMATAVEACQYGCNRGSGTCRPCPPNCVGKCGGAPDSCGGTCASCPGVNQVCQGQTCVGDPCVPDPCNAHGDCSNGSCTCEESYGGATCSSCAAGYESNYPACTPLCAASATENDLDTTGFGFSAVVYDGSGYGAIWQAADGLRFGKLNAAGVQQGASVPLGISGDSPGLAWSAADSRFGVVSTEGFICLDSSGTPLGSVVPLKGAGATIINGTSIAYDDAGNFGIVWADNRSGDSRIYFNKSASSSCSFVQSEAPITTVWGSNSTIRHGVSEFGVAWVGGGKDIYLSRVDHAGSKIGNDLLIAVGNTTTSAQLAWQADAAEWAVAWSDQPLGLLKANIYLQRASAGELVGSRVNVTNDQGHPNRNESLTASIGGFGLQWLANTTAMFKRLASNGDAASPQIQVGGNAVGSVASDGSNFMTVYQSGYSRAVDCQ